MNFLKKNAVNLIIFFLIFGVAGTLINLMIPVQSYDYEAYYTLDGEGSPNTSGELNALINENINNQFSMKAVEVEHDANSNILQLNIHNDSISDIETVKSQFDTLLSEEGYGIEDTSGANIYETANTILQVFILVISLFMGLIFGLLFPLMNINRNISTDEDFQYHLDERIIGTF